jgi:hypothetical protein
MAEIGQLATFLKSLAEDRSALERFRRAPEEVLRESKLPRSLQFAVLSYRQDVIEAALRTEASDIVAGGDPHYIRGHGLAELLASLEAPG